MLQLINQLKTPEKGKGAKKTNLNYKGYSTINKHIDINILNRYSENYNPEILVENKLLFEKLIMKFNKLYSKYCCKYLTNNDEIEYCEREYKKFIDLIKLQVNTIIANKIDPKLLNEIRNFKKIRKLKHYKNKAKTYGVRFCPKGKQIIYGIFKKKKLHGKCILVTKDTGEKYKQHYHKGILQSSTNTRGTKSGAFKGRDERDLTDREKKIIDSYPNILTGKKFTKK